MFYQNNKHSGPDTQLKGSVRPCSIMLLNEVASNFLHLKKVENHFSHCLLTLPNKQVFKMVSTNSNWSEQDWTSHYKRVYHMVHSRLWNVDHAPCFTGATLMKYGHNTGTSCPHTLNIELQRFAKRVLDISHCSCPHYTRVWHRTYPIRDLTFEITVVWLWAATEIMPKSLF